MAILTRENTRGQDINMASIRSETDSFIITCRYPDDISPDNFIRGSAEKAKVFCGVTSIFTLKAWGVRGYR